MEPKPISVYIVDDHPLFRTGLKIGLGQDPGILVIGESGDAFHAISAVQSQPPDVLLVDLEMPLLSGISVIALLRQTYPDMIMIVLSGHRNAAYVADAMEVGANGYLLKNIDVEDLSEVIHGFAERRQVISPYLINLTVEVPARADSATAGNTPTACSSLLASLSPREQEVLEALIAGKPNKEIALLLGLSTETIKTHVHNILRKLQVANRAEAAALASRQLRRSGT